MVSILPSGSFSVSQDWFCCFEFVQIEAWRAPRFCLMPGTHRAPLQSWTPKFCLRSSSVLCGCLNLIHTDPTHDLGNTFQSAYKVGHSTETALLHFKMRFIYLCPKACLKHWCCSTCLQPVILSTMTHSFPVCQLGLVLLALF